MFRLFDLFCLPVSPYASNRGAGAFVPQWGRSRECPDLVVVEKGCLVMCSFYRVRPIRTKEGIHIHGRER
jgi:hypothetical protein